jgi:hypothetical protein
VKATDRFFLDGVSCLMDGRRMPVSNLSLGGFFAATPQPPMKGQVLALGLDLPGQPPIRVVARVTWINDLEQPRADGMPQGFGVKITEIDLAGKLALVGLLKRSAHSGAPRRQTTAG